MNTMTSTKSPLVEMHWYLAPILSYGRLVLQPITVAERRVRVAVSGSGGKLAPVK